MKERRMVSDADSCIDKNNNEKTSDGGMDLNYN